MKALLCLLAVLPTPALALTADDYLSHCRGHSTYDRAVCMGELDAVLERDAQAQNSLLGGSAITTALAAPAYCLPPGANLRQLRDRIIPVLASGSTATRSGDAKAALRATLRRVYPPAPNCLH
ncbi:Rap1a/Tai family immunity protein [Solimonas marina]|uniref:Rap1a immunity protein domain-containing protein n=1 Tax=Solimonas marina TaxID=2714601 RepID=A0A970B7F5_9GAMM|nr:Rap1a/Tai family immunity protein [Solimonas marina]NKF21144.1 hypothetical protein [Solimonas marina]